MLEVFHNYNDLCIQIDILEMEIQSLEKERENWWWGGDLFHTVPLDNAASRVDKLSQQIKDRYELLDHKKRLQKAIKGKLSELQGLEYKVAYKRFVEGKSLAKIAEDLNHSEIWIKQVSARVSKKLEHTANILTY